jgi:hypothetical protein
MITTRRRVAFNLSNFITELSVCLEGRPEEIDDVVQTYKDFLSHISDELRGKVMAYMDERPEVKSNKELKSYISACYK